MNDRIRLAEAMGYVYKGSVNDKHFVHNHGSLAGCQGMEPLPDPFTDANDDYAVLEWMRQNSKLIHLRSRYWGRASYYQIGDYARAALKVIDEY